MIACQNESSNSVWIVLNDFDKKKLKVLDFIKITMKNPRIKWAKYFSLQNVGLTFTYLKQSTAAAPRKKMKKFKNRPSYQLYFCATGDFQQSITFEGKILLYSGAWSCTGPEKKQISPSHQFWGNPNMSDTMGISSIKLVSSTGKS